MKAKQFETVTFYNRFTSYTIGFIATIALLNGKLSLVGLFIIAMFVLRDIWYTNKLARLVKPETPIPFWKWWRDNEHELARVHYDEDRWVGIYQLMLKASERKA